MCLLSFCHAMQYAILKCVCASLLVVCHVSTMMQKSVTFDCLLTRMHICTHVILYNVMYLLPGMIMMIMMINRHSTYYHFSPSLLHFCLVQNHNECEIGKKMNAIALQMWFLCLIIKCLSLSCMYRNTINRYA